MEDNFLGYEADTAAYCGQLRKAREFSTRAAASAERADEHETAASYEVEAALREALFGNTTEVRYRIDSALRAVCERNRRRKKRSPSATRSVIKLRRESSERFVF